MRIDAPAEFVEYRNEHGVKGSQIALPLHEADASRPIE